MVFSENERIELKISVTDDICKEVIAFANTNGGTLYIGMADNGDVIGVQDADEVTLQINNKIRDSVKPDLTMFVRYEQQEIDGKEILAVTVQKGTGRPYYLASKGLRPGGVFVRNGSASDPATDTAIRRMIKETDGDSFEDMRSLEQSLSFDAARAQFAGRGTAFDAAKMQTLGLVSPDGIYSNLALLLSDQCSSLIKAATFAGSDKTDFQDRREFSGSLFRQLEDVYAYLDLRNRTSATFDGLYRVDKRDYPEEAVREALLNSIVHRDYSYSAATLISVYDDRIEFVSVGGLPMGITTEDIMLGLSVCRNPKLAAVFYRLKLIEAYGTGIPKIMNAYADCAVKPKIEVTPNAFKITLPNLNSAAQSSGISTAEGKIMAFVAENGRILRSEADKLLHVSASTSGRILKRMVADGFLRQEGEGRNTVYIKK